MMKAVKMGSKSSGITLEHIMRKESVNDISGWSPMAASMSGPAVATTRLQSNEYVATWLMLPPSMPVMTGAAVAVGTNTHMNRPVATVWLSGATRQ